MTIYTKDLNYSAATTDISEGGMGVISERAMNPWTKVYLSLKFIDDSAIKGRVKWLSHIFQDQKILYRIGIEIENIIWTNLKAIGFAEGADLVAKVLSATTRQGERLDKKIAINAS